MRIGFDVDGLLADFNTAFIDLIVSETGKDLFPPRPFDIPVWNYPEHYGYTKDETSRVWEVIKASPTFWATLPPYATTRSVLRLLNRWHYEDTRHTVVFITNRMGVDADKQTYDWLQAYGFDMPTVCLSGDKGEAARDYQLNAYLDDKLENAIDVAMTSQTRSYLLNRPWNTGKDCGLAVTRVQSVGEFLASLDVVGVLSVLLRESF